MKHGSLKLSLCSLIFLILTFTASSALCATYYVSKDGNDDNNGTEKSPLLTIQKAVVVSGAGDLILVEDGNYNEVVVVNKSGVNDSTLITIRARNQYKAKCKGFILQGDYITVEGFTIEASAATQFGIYAYGQSNITVNNCHIIDCPGGGINLTGNATNCNVTGNVLEHNGQWGVHVVGSRVLIENNEILKTVQHHPKIVFTGFHGEDADGIRIFGSNHTIRGNYLHDLGNVEDPGNHEASEEFPQDFPHVDCIQSWDRSAHGGRPVIKHSIIENNRCSLVRKSGKGVMISAVDNGSTNLTIINNIFEYRDIGISMNIGSFSDIYIYNNVFKANLNDTSWGTSLHLKNIENYAVLNNIMVDCHTEVRKITGGTGIVDYNLAWYSDNSTPYGTPESGPHELWGVNPDFVDYTGQIGGNYRLQQKSQAIDKGFLLSAVPMDIDGRTRPIGSVHDIGPHEFSSSITTYSLTYRAGAGGSIGGFPSQKVDQGSNGKIVRAIPLSGFFFAGWSDGSTANPRRDLNVSADIDVTANFTGSFPRIIFLPAIMHTEN